MVFLSSVVYRGFAFLCSAGVSRFAEYVYPTGAPGPCSQLLVESKLFICMCYFVCMILVTVTLCSLLCMSNFHILSLSLDYIILITSITLVPLTTLWLKSLIYYLKYFIPLSITGSVLFLIPGKIKIKQTVLPRSYWGCKHIFCRYYMCTTTRLSHFALLIHQNVALFILMINRMSQCLHQTTMRRLNWMI